MSSSFESYEEYVEIHSRCMRQLDLPVSDSTITCLQVKQMGKLMMMVIHGCSKELPASCWSCIRFTKVLANFCIDQDLGITLGSKLMASGPSQGSVLDGSSNIIAAVSTGSIIGVYSPYESNDISTLWSEEQILIVNE
ncbi:hypothetical protein DY000_02002986 [Brassica cretica]|uniref:Uncharacterized protein n=1 Tax=Brassica cretica TaxID=69181 RepID=A0ABQ7CE30_BRACR|nr:hypothetical protein DY000_02002986 [Brassica cretica]